MLQQLFANVGADAQLRLGSRIKRQHILTCCSCFTCHAGISGCACSASTTCMWLSIYAALVTLSYFSRQIKHTTAQLICSRHFSNWGVTLYGEEQGSISCKHGQRPIPKLEQSGEALTCRTGASCCTGTTYIWTRSHNIFLDVC